MAKSKSTEETAGTSPFGGFKILQGEFPPPPATDDIQDGDDVALVDKTDDTEEEQTDDQKQRMLEADKKLEKVAEKAAKNSKKTEDVAQDETDEEAEDEVEDDTDTDNLADESDDDNTESPLKEFAKSLYNKGVLDFDDSDEEFEDSEEGLEKLVNKTVENRINDWVSNLPDEYSKFLEFVQNGGQPKDFLNVYYGNHSWETYKVENESQQIVAVEESLRLTGETEEDIRDMVEEWRDNGTLEKRAKSALTKLQRIEAGQKQELVEIQKQQAAKQKAAQKQYWDNFKNSLFEREDIKGFKLTPKMKEQLWHHMTAIDKSTGKTGYQMAVEQDNEASLLFALQSMLGFDIKKLEKQVESKVSNKFSKMLKNYNKSSKEKISSGGTQDFGGGNNPFSGFKSVKL